jgi:hypothetical protein
MTKEERRRPEVRPSWSGEAGARRLFVRVRDAGLEGDDLPSRLELGLRAALEMLAANPDLARLLTVDPYLGGDQAALDAQREWIDRLGKLMNAAAASDPRASRESDFLARFLVGGVRFQIARRVLNGEASDLSRLLPSLLTTLLSYYFEPTESRRLTLVAIGDHAGDATDQLACACEPCPPWRPSISRRRE